MVELVDTLASGASDSNIMEVRVLFRPHYECSISDGARVYVGATPWRFKSSLRHKIAKNTSSITTNYKSLQIYKCT